MLQSKEQPTVSCQRTTLTFLQVLEQFEQKAAPSLCPMETAAYIISYNNDNDS